MTIIPFHLMYSIQDLEARTDVQPGISSTLLPVISDHTTISMPLGLFVRSLSIANLATFGRSVRTQLLQELCPLPSLTTVESPSFSPNPILQVQRVEWFLILTSVYWKEGLDMKYGHGHDLREFSS
jgi:hypothetical protein